MIRFPIFIHLRFILIGLSLLSTLIMIVYPDTIKGLVDLQLAIYTLLIIVDFVTDKCLNLLQIWIAGFIFIILSEMIQYTHTHLFVDSMAVPICFYLTANNLVILGYLCKKSKPRKNVLDRKIIRPEQFLVFCIFCILIYVITKLPSTLSKSNYGGGSSMGNGSFLGSFISGIGYVIPSAIGYYYRYRHKPLIGIILVIPIFIILFMGGSRYRLIFSILPYLITSGFITIYKPDFRKLLTVIITIVAFSFISGYVKNFRTNHDASIEDYLSLQETTSQKTNDPMLKIVSQLSPEGCVKMASLADDYFANHNLKYGSESGFLFIFWIPRSLWPNKPTMLDHWLIRAYYGNVSSGYSTASGFMGELRADFGRWSLIVAFFLGFLLRYADNFVKGVFKYGHNNILKIFAAILYPATFFFVRSPLTTSFTLITELMFFFIILSFFTRSYHKPIIPSFDNKICSRS